MENLIQTLLPPVSGLILGLAIIAPFLLKARMALKEIGELLVDAGKSLEDGRLTLEEVKLMIADIKEIVSVFK